MQTPPQGKRRHDNPELRAKYAQKKPPTKRQRKLEARQYDYDTNKLDSVNGFHFIRPGSNNG
jgi:hypothetical protein